MIRLFVLYGLYVLFGIVFVAATIFCLTCLLMNPKKEPDHTPFIDFDTTYPHDVISTNFYAGGKLISSMKGDANIEGDDGPYSKVVFFRDGTSCMIVDYRWKYRTLGLGRWAWGHVRVESTRGL